MIQGNYMSNVMIHITEEDINNITNARNSDLEKIVPKIEFVNCPLCDSNNPENIISTPQQWELGLCRNCGVAYAYMRPTLELCNILYRYYIPSNLTNPDIRNSQIESRPKELNDDIDWIESYSWEGSYTRRGCILDVGASSGDFLVYARVRGWKVEATELSELCAEFMAKTLNISVLLGNISDIPFEDKKYNAITLRHSIEHMREPIKELNILNKALADNGVLFISTPEHAKDLDLLKEKHMLPLHIVNYTEETLDFLLSKTGFKLAEYESLESDSEIRNMRAIALKVDV